MPFAQAGAADDIAITGLVGKKAIIQINGRSHIIPEGESSPEGVKDEVEVNGLRLGNIQATVHDSDYPTVVLLGMSFLKHLDIRHNGNVLHLNKR